MKSLPSSHSHGSNLLSYLQMIESSDHGDEYDGVIFSQLVRWFFLSVKTAYLFQLYGLSQQLFSISSFPFFVLFWPWGILRRIPTVGGTFKPVPQPKLEVPARTERHRFSQQRRLPCYSNWKIHVIKLNHKYTY